MRAGRGEPAWEASSVPYSSLVTRHYVIGKVARLWKAVGFEEVGVVRGAAFQPGGSFGAVPLDEVGEPDAGPALEGRGHRADGVGGETVEQGREDTEGGARGRVLAQVGPQARRAAGDDPGVEFGE